MKFISLCLLLSAFLISCKNSNSETPKTGDTASAVSCSVVEGQMNSVLGSTEAADGLPYTYLIKRLSDGREFSFSKSGSSANTLYESASTSKLVSAVIILRAADVGVLSLTSKPQDLIVSPLAWPIPSTDPLYSMTLSNLLSFTSGLTNEPTCLNLSAGNFGNCVNTIGTTNSGGSLSPGTEFYYSSTHLQVAGQMLVKAKTVASWQDVFSNFKTDTGLFPNSTYDLPSATNPRLAGGMHWTARDYLDFLYKLAKGQLLSETGMLTFLQDRTASAKMTYSPVKSSSLNEEWHYGFGYWHECQNSVWNCTAGSRISSPGAYGAYPFWDRQNSYIGIVARQSASTGTFPYGVSIERAIRSLSQDWASCK